MHLEDPTSPPTAPPQTSGEERRAALQPLEWGALQLATEFATKVPRWSQFQEVSNAVQRVHAAAAASLAGQQQALNATLEVVRDMSRVGAWKPVLFLHHVVYDETPLQVRVAYASDISDHKDRQTGKVFVGEHGWTIVVQQLQTGNSIGPASSGSFALLEGNFSPQVRAAGNSTGETIDRTLESMKGCPDSDVLPDNLFEWRVRLSETDEAPANHRAESFAAQRRPDFCHIHTLCLCHKLHTAAQRTWALQKEEVTGLLHVCKILSTVGAMGCLKNMVSKTVAQRLVVEETSVLSPDAVSFRSAMVTHFGPPTSQPRRRAIWNLAEQFFGGDWRDPTRLVHTCSGKLCCSSPAESKRKATTIFLKLLSTFNPRMFNRGNWASWSSSLSFFGLAAIHSIIPDAFQKAFRRPDKQHSDEHASLDDGVIDAPHMATESSDLRPAAMHLENEQNLYVEQSGEAPPDAVAVERARYAHSLKVALEFLDRSCYGKVYMLLVTLHAQRQLMASMLHSVSLAWEREQLARAVRNGERQFRLAALAEGEDLRLFFQRLWETWDSGVLWQSFSHTESWRSRLLQLTMRVGAVVHQLIQVRCKAFPVRLFLLLHPQFANNDFAKTLLRTKSCLLDGFTKALFQRFNTPAKLLSPECTVLLVAIARRAQANTFSVERLHSKNLRAAVARMTHKPDVEHLSLLHSAFAAPRWLPSRPEKSGEKKMASSGKRKRRKLEDDDAGAQAPVETQGREHDAQPRKVRRTGGGGAWRAFVHTRSGKQKLTRESATALSIAYASLTPEEKMRYKQLGAAGCQR